MLMFSRFAAHPTASDGIPQSVTLIAEPKKYNRLAMLRRGDADVLLDTPASFVPQIEARMGYRIAQVPTYESLFFLFNFAHTHLADTATRTHLARLIASLDIAKKLNDPSLYALTQFAPSGVFGFAPDLVDGKTTTKSFDDTLFLTVGVTETNRKIVEILQTELEPKGVKLAIETVSDAELADGVKTGRFDAALFGWQYGLGTVDEFFTKLVHSPRDGRGEFAGYGYRSRAADDTIDAALRETNVKKRLADWQDVATRIVARDVIGAPLLGTRRLYAVREGFAFTPRMDGLVIFTADDEND